MNVLNHVPCVVCLLRNVVRETDVPIQRQLITISYVHPAVLEHILSYMVTN